MLFGLKKFCRIDEYDQKEEKLACTHCLGVLKLALAARQSRAITHPVNEALNRAELAGGKVLVPKSLITEEHNRLAIDD